MAGENKIIGFLQGQFVGNELKRDINNKFKIHRARFGISGKLDELIIYNVVLGAIETPDNNPHLVNAFVGLNYSPYLQVRLGQFLLPFGLEGPQPIFLNLVIERTMVIKRLNPFKMFRDIGLQLSGKYKSFNYAVAVINGTGANSSDDNNAKDILGRIGFSPVQNIKIGISSHFGKYASNTKKNLDRRRYALDIKFAHKGLQLRSEIQNRNDEQVDGSIKVNTGWYILSAYKVTQKLEPIIRYEQYFPNAHDLKVKSDIIALGFNYYLSGNGRVSVNYEFKNDIEHTDAVNLLTAQLQIVF